MTRPCRCLYKQQTEPRIMWHLWALDLGYGSVAAFASRQTWSSRKQNGAQQNAEQTRRPSTRIAHQTGRSVFIGLDAHDLPAFTGWCRYQIGDGVRATQAGHVTAFFAAIEMSELESVRDGNRPHVARETLPERDEPGTQLVTRGQMLQGSQDLLVLSHVEQLDGVHRALVGGRSDAACHACVVLPRGSRAEPVELLEQPLGLSRLDCNRGFGKLEAQLGHDLRAERNAFPALRHNLAFCSTPREQ